ncbi:hypothetical protein [Streptomyces bugieae]|uniref:Uncharacterized protein n=1 Tax=Streptomyces bugieae TaxID=3098223 RepID=A0ABU7NL57_9ACTN|nr:hypothetical protein [Streptomyces sp. DSM 41528]
MALACPRCKHDGLLDLPEYVASLPRESPLHGKYGQPPEYKMQWLLPAGACAAGAVALVSGSIAAGLLLLAGGIGVGVWLWRKSSAAEDARARWSRSMICRQCPVVFPREDAVAL